MIKRTSLCLGLALQFAAAPVLAQQAPPPPAHGHGDHAEPGEAVPATAGGAPVVAGAAPVVTPPLSPVPAPTQAELRARRVQVTIDSNEGDAVIERRVSTEESMGAFFFFVPYRGITGTWEQVCVTPCRVELDRYSSYRVAGVNGITESSRFTLPQQSDPLLLHVESGSAVRNRIGRGLVAVGAAAVVVGVSLLIAAPSFHKDDDARLAAYVTGGAGLVTLGIGIPLAILNRSKVLADGGRNLSFLPEVPLGKSAKITPRGLVF